MKLNKILSSALIIVMLFTGIIAVTPIYAGAAEAAPVVTVKENDEITEDEIKTILSEYRACVYATSEEMFRAEYEAGYLDSIESSKYSVYVNRYTGVSYYVNNVSGQILTSNPVDPGYSGSVLDEAVMSQIELTYFNSSAPEKPIDYNSFNWINQGSVITVSKTEDGKGIAVDYILGEAASSLIAPGAIMSSTLEEKIATPMFTNFANLMQQHCGDFPAEGIKFNKGTLTSYNLADEANNGFLRNCGEYEKSFVNAAMSAYISYARDILGRKNDVFVNVISKYADHVKNFFGQYQVYNLANPLANDTTIALWAETVPAILDENEAAFVLSADATLTTRRLINAALKYCVPTYTVDNVEIDELECRYVNAGIALPSFTCRLVYTLADDGSLIVDFPANAIQYDESEFTLKNITPLKYFGCGDMSREGYILYPDGSGTVIDFADFYVGSMKYSINISGKVYGQDYCYSKITGTRREQITMPVYGVINQVAANAATQTLTGGKTAVTNGFFAILEEGASLAELGVRAETGTNKYAAAFASYTPYPSDEYSLSEALSVGSGTYFIVSDSKYEGSYKTRYTMLADEDVAAAVKLVSPDMPCYDASYVGMANRYRDYLKDEGVLGGLESVSEDIPLYIEALGSMEVTQKILTFPVTVSIPLTTFEDIRTMYDELADAKNKLLAKRDEYIALADALAKEGEEPEQEAIYREKADDYQRLADNVQNITNVNFKLTGFANGGMYFRYPAKVRWENVLGGHNGFCALLDYSKELNAGTTGANLGIYPDFDFLFINNSGWFDGVSNGSDAAKMVDNRYASKQVYDSISGEYERLFALVISTDVLDRLYSKFNNDFHRYEPAGLSVSTLGSTLNSNFDDKRPINREQALAHVLALLDKMANENNYSLMTDVGNIYSVEFIDHIINANIDSSHFAYSSYAIPFYGMVLHGHVSYSGSPINYSGSPKYDILRSIESGASPLYILCMQNTSYLKDDYMLSKYYGVDYSTWFDKVVEQYAIINEAIGDLQQHEIVYHSTLIAERIIDEDEMNANYVRLIAEFLEQLDMALSELADETIENMRLDPANIGKGLCINIDRASIIAKANEILGIPEAELEENKFTEKLDALIAEYNAEYPAKTGAVEVSFSGNDIAYDSVYAYVSDSVANAKDYEYTDFTCDNNNVVMVTYKNASGDTATFLLNYNVYSVEITVDNTIDHTLADGEVKTYTLDKYGFVKIYN